MKIKIHQIKNELFLSKGFIIGLLILLTNDFYLKTHFGNPVTGKLSDFAGLFIFPIFFSAFFIKHKRAIYFFTFIFFLWWKSSLSQGGIEYFNSMQIFHIARVVDYTDYIALITLPFSYAYVIHISSGQKNMTCTFRRNNFRSMVVISIIAISMFSFIATSILYTIKYTKRGASTKTYLINKPLDEMHKDMLKIDSPYPYGIRENGIHFQRGVIDVDKKEPQQLVVIFNYKRSDYKDYLQRIDALIKIEPVGGKTKISLIEIRATNLDIKKYKEKILTQFEHVFINPLKAN